MSFLIVLFDSANSPFQAKPSLGIVAGRSLMKLLVSLARRANNDKKANNGKLPNNYYNSIMNPIAALTTMLQITKEDVRNELRKLEKNAKKEASNAFANVISNLPTSSVSAESSA
eukprot:scaffold51319_cov44-Cyclotella_meneghiniana.AAC.2